MVQIIPAILEKTESGYETILNRYLSCEALKNGWIHIDFADNNFVQNQTIEPKITSKFPANFKKEAHLMVSHPKDWIDKLVDADFERIIFHIESEDDTEEVIEYIKSKNIEVGLAIRMDTPIEKLEPFVDKIDMVVVMSIVPGFQGQSFIPQSINRIMEIKSKNWPIKVEVDGGIRDQNIKSLAEAGADNLIVASFLLKGDTDENLEVLWEAINA